MKVLFLIEGWISPAPRYRVLQYLPYLIEDGIHFQVRALHGHSYPFFYHWPLVGSVYKAFTRFFRRWFHLRDAHQYDVVFQQRLSVPFSSFLERRLAKKNPRFVFDFDDAIFQTEAGSDPKRKKVFDDVVACASHVVAGSDYLASWAGTNTTVIPTVINTDQYLPASQSNSGNQLIIGWIGTHSNYPNFQPIMEAFTRVLEEHEHVVFHLVSDREPPFFLPRMRFTKWDKDSEISHLQSFHIGIMPLEDHSWNRGKCAFKLIQYMSVGLPVVAGRVGANAEVVLDGETGFLAQSVDEWVSALNTLIGNKKLRKDMGALGRDRCVAHYSLTSCKKKLIAVLEDAASKNT